MARTRFSRSCALGLPSALGLTSFILAASTAQAQVVDLAPDLDATIYEDFGAGGDTGNGSGNYIFAGNTAGGDIRRAFLRFDLTSIPAGATINSVTLTLNMNMTIAGDQVVNLHRALGQWGEGASTPGGMEGAGTAAEPRDVTWTERLYPDCPWTAPGGDFDASVSGSATVGSAGSYTFAGPGLGADVQAWIDGALPNHGWMLANASSSGNATAKRFASREWPIPSERPRLTVDYTAGTGSGAVNYCGPAVQNSTGCPATIWWSGSLTVADTNFSITADGLPAGQFGYFITSQTQGFFMPGASSGFVCVSGNIGRFNFPGGIISGPSGSVALNLSAFPTNPPVPVQPGDTWNLQCWYRDTGNTSNFTNGLQVTFD